MSDEPHPLSDARAAVLRAAVDRIIPPDDQTPGGVDAGAFDFMLRELRPGGGLYPHLLAYENGLDGLDLLARGTYGVPFADLSPSLQDAALIAYEEREPRFVRVLAEHAQEGFYTSPAGWEMVGWRVNG